MTFAIATNQECADIVIFDDNIFENDETFILNLESLNERVLIPIASSTVTIMDNDGWCLKHFKILVFNSLSKQE